MRVSGAQYELLSDDDRKKVTLIDYHLDREAEASERARTARELGIKWPKRSTDDFEEYRGERSYREQDY